MALKNSSDNTETLLKIIETLSKKKQLAFFEHAVANPEIMETKNSLEKVYFYLEFIGPWLYEKNNPIFDKLSLVPLQVFIFQALISSDLEVYDETLFESLKSIIGNLNDIAHHNFELKDMLLDAAKVFCQSTNQNNIGEQLIKFSSSLKILFAHEETDSAALRALLYHFTQKEKRDPDTLNLLLVKLVECDSTDRTVLLDVTKKLLNNNKAIKPFDDLIEAVSENREFVKAQFDYPPYPDVPTLLDWLAIENENNRDAAIASFDRAPYGERAYEFSFQSETFEKQKEKFSEDIRILFTDTLRDTWASLLGSKGTLSQLSTGDILNKLPELNRDPASLLAYISEIMARTTSQRYPGKSEIISQELNTTQLMALYAMIKSGTKLVNQVDTGEGKSRMGMTLLSYEVLEGEADGGVRNTVDFTTNNLKPAQRDFSNYAAFFAALGIKTSLIYAGTSSRTYCVGGVNFSEPGQLRLARNKAMAEGDKAAFFAADPRKRVLIADEGDVLLLDSMNDHYNYASFTSQLKEYTWIYPHLMAFIRSGAAEGVVYDDQTDKSDAFKEIYESDKLDDDVLFNRFLGFIKSAGAEPVQEALLHRLRREKPNQLNTWFQSAWIAHNMEEDVHYKVSKKFEPRQTPQGIVFACEVEVINTNQNRVVRGSQYNGGIHQCLSAKKNADYQIKHPDMLLEPCHIDPEKAIQVTSTAYTLQNDYSEGKQIALTGTSGSTLVERPELEGQGFKVFKTPRHTGFNRFDYQPIVAKNEARQREILIEELIKSHKKKQPVLIICRSDKESTALYKALEAYKFGKDAKQSFNLQRVAANNTEDEENSAVEKAVSEGMITVSTSMLGRGTDFGTTGAKKTDSKETGVKKIDGLKVVATYLPRKRGGDQIWGRTGRYGQPGETIIIANRETDLPRMKRASHFFPAKIEEAQEKMDRHAQRERFFEKKISDFIDEVEKLFFDKVDRRNEKMLLDWQEWLDQFEKAWTPIASELVALIGVLSEKKPNKKKPNEVLDTLSAIDEKFNAFLESMLKSSPDAIDREKASSVINTPPLGSALTFFKDIGYTNRKLSGPTVSHAYERGHDGQACVYDTPFAQTLAMIRGERKLFANTRAWWNGEGVLFANTRALLNGQRKIFANLRAWIQRLLNALRSNKKDPNANVPLAKARPLSTAGGKEILRDDEVIPQAKPLFDKCEKLIEIEGELPAIPVM